MKRKSLSKLLMSLVLGLGLSLGLSHSDAKAYSYNAPSLSIIDLEASGMSVPWTDPSTGTDILNVPTFSTFYKTAYGGGSMAGFGGVSFDYVYAIGTTPGDYGAWGTDGSHTNYGVAWNSAASQYVGLPCLHMQRAADGSWWSVDDNLQSLVGTSYYAQANQYCRGYYPVHGFYSNPTGDNYSHNVAVHIIVNGMQSFSNSDSSWTIANQLLTVNKPGNIDMGLVRGAATRANCKDAVRILASSDVAYAKQVYTAWFGTPQPIYIPTTKTGAASWVGFTRLDNDTYYGYDTNGEYTLRSVVHYNMPTNKGQLNLQ